MNTQPLEPPTKARSRLLPLSDQGVEALLTKEELRIRLNLPHVRIIEEMTRKRKLPVCRLGHRTLRYSWPAVQKALEKLTIREVGA